MPRISLLCFSLAALLALTPGWLGAQQPTKVLGRIVAAKVLGNVTVTDVRDPLHPHKLVESGEVTEGQIINTGDDARVLLVFSNGATVNLAAKSTLSIDEFLQDPFTQTVKVAELVDEPTTSITKLNLVRGELMSNVKHLRRDKGSVFSVQTPVGAAGIRGTSFQLLYRPLGSAASFVLRMVEGRIALDFGSKSRLVEVEKDQQVVLDAIPIDASGRIITLPASIKPGELPASLKATLNSALQQQLEAVNAVNFQPLKATAAPQQAYPQAGGSTSEGSGSDGTTPTGFSAGAASATQPLSPVPPAVAPAPRTTPGDGKL